MHWIWWIYLSDEEDLLSEMLISFCENLLVMQKLMKQIPRIESELKANRKSRRTEISPERYIWADAASPSTAWRIPAESHYAYRVMNELTSGGGSSTVELPDTFRLFIEFHRMVSNKIFINENGISPAFGGSFESNNFRSFCLHLSPTLKTEF